MEYSNASPVMREHRFCRPSRAWQKAETYIGEHRQREVKGIAEEYVKVKSHGRRETEFSAG
jgi:hypothetical protein